MELAIFNNDSPPLELIEFIYREKFKLSYKEIMEEPADVFQLNLTIMKLLNEKEQNENKSLERKAKRANKRK